MLRVFKPPYILLVLFYLVLLLQNSWVEGFFHDGYLYSELGKNAAFENKWLIPHLNNEVYAEFYHHLPFVFILEGLFFKIFGASYITARIFISFFGLSSLVVLLNWLRREKGDKVAWLTGIVFILTFPLIKKTRFPNLDIPLMFFMLCSFKAYFYALKSNNNKNWSISGIFFGFALLTKPPIALFIPFIILVHLLTNRKMNNLLRLPPWFGLFLGIIIFSIWPLSLFFNEKFHIFKSWFNFTFLHTISDGRGIESSLFTYLIFLIKKCNIWFILTLVSIWKFFKKDFDKKLDDSLFKLSFSFFILFICLLSLAKFKYSHYLIPIYPFQAILVGYLGSLMTDDTFKKVASGFKFIAVTVTLLLLIFPLTNKSKRDQEIFEVKHMLDRMDVKPRKWKIINNIYPYWSLNNLNSWHDLGQVESVSEFRLDKLGEKEVILLHESAWEKVKNKHSNLVPLYYFSKRKMYVLLTNDFFKSQAYFIK